MNSIADQATHDCLNAWLIVSQRAVYDERRALSLTWAIFPAPIKPIFSQSCDVLSPLFDFEDTGSDCTEKQRIGALDAKSFANPSLDKYDPLKMCFELQLKVANCDLETNAVGVSK